MDLEQAIEQVNWNRSKEVIKFYESNSLYFANKKVDTDLSVSYELLDIKTAYLNALDNEGHYSKAYDFIRILDIDFNQIIDKENPDYTDLFEVFQFIEARVLSRLKKYEASQSIFKKLIKLNPHKDVYHDWYNGNKASILRKQTVFIGWFGFAIIMLDIVLSVTINFSLGAYTSIIGFALMMLGFYYPNIRYWFNKLIKNK